MANRGDRAADLVRAGAEGGALGRSGIDHHAALDDRFGRPRDHRRYGGRVHRGECELDNLAAGSRRGTPRMAHAVAHLQDVLGALAQVTRELLLEQILELLMARVVVIRLLPNGCTVDALP